MACSICHKKVKEDTYGNDKYCQGHDQFEVQRLERAKTPQQRITEMKARLEKARKIGR